MALTIAMTMAVNMALTVGMAIFKAVVFFALLFVPRDLTLLLLCLSFHLFFTPTLCQSLWPIVFLLSTYSSVVKAPL